MNPEIQWTEHERRRYEPWPQPRARRLYLALATAGTAICDREPTVPPLRVSLGEVARRIAA